jgi:hypothetical protein
MPEEIRTQLLTFKQLSSAKYRAFRDERFVLKTKRLSDTIHRTNLKTFNSIRTDQKLHHPKKTVQKKFAYAQKIIDTARVRECDMKEVFRYDLIPSSGLLDAEGLMTKPLKSSLCHELEKSLSSDDYKHPSHWDKCNTTYPVDVMAYMRRTRTKNLKTFGELRETMFNMVLNTCKNPARTDFVFGSYIEGSVKDSERSRRATVSAIEISAINVDTPLPICMDTFWTSGSNKTKLQKLLRT